jgi:hypothetical protein
VKTFHKHKYCEACGSELEKSKIKYHYNPVTGEMDVYMVKIVCPNARLTELNHTHKTWFENTKGSVVFDPFDPFDGEGIP